MSDKDEPEIKGAAVELLTEDDPAATPADLLRSILRVCRNTNGVVHKILAGMQPPKDGEGQPKDRLKAFEDLLEGVKSSVEGLPDEIEERLPAPVATEIWKKLEAPQPAAGGGGGAAAGAGAAG